MSNFEAHENLSAYLDGMLSGPELAQMEEALAADADLRAELEELREMVQGLGSLPTHEAPAGLMAGVLASVADLPIPTADGADLGSGPGESTELVAPVAEPLPSNVVRLAWFKAPAVATALAASLVFGFVWITQQSDPAGAPEPAAFEAAVAEAPPQPSGVVPGDEFDAVADLGVAEGEEHARERLAGRLAGAEEKPELLESAEPDVMNGAAGAAAPPAGAAARPAPAPRRESVPESVVGPDGVFEADWESGDAVADADAPEEEMGEPGPAEVAFAPEPPGGALAAADPSVDDVTLDDEPLEDFTDPPGDEELLEVASAAAPASSGAMRRGDSGSTSSRSSASRSRGPVSLDEVTFTAVGQATVMVSDQAKADELLTALRGRGWSVQSNPASEGRIAVTVISPESQRSEVLRILRAHGSLRISTAGEPSDGYQRIDVTVSF